jgi:predicted nucleic acid-binding protein
MELVDTNVLLYVYDALCGDRSATARSLVSMLGRSRSGALSVQVLQEFFVSAVTEIAQPLTPEEGRDRVTNLARWPTHEPNAADVVAAASISAQRQLSFWDAMIMRSASDLGCRSSLWTEDLNDRQVIEGVRIVNPFKT